MAVTKKSYPRWDLLVHAAPFNTKILSGIKHSGGLIPFDSEGSATPGVYTHYLWHNRDWTQGMEWHWPGQLLFFIDTRVLKDLPFMVCDHHSFGGCLEDPKRLIMSGPGNMPRKPRMDRLQKHINTKRIQHEIIILDKVALSYIKGIAVSGSTNDLKMVQRTFPDILVVGYPDLRVPTRLLFSKSYLAEDKDIPKFFYFQEYLHIQGFLGSDPPVKVINHLLKALIPFFTQIAGAKRLL
jgi:hypothetical protein